ncbi:MAG: DUF5011 domain-containing protein [Bacilli bacterium]|nr:DUF5011 domain-containing protein [Bacilli bacterium]
MKKRTVVLFSLASACLLAGAGALSAHLISKNNSAISVKAGEPEMVFDTPINNDYFLGDTLEVPNGKIKYEVNGSTKYLMVNDYYLVYPDGNAKTGEVFALNQIGSYELVFSGEYNGNTVTCRKGFVVNQGAYALKSVYSSVNYVNELKTMKKEPKSGLELDLVDGDMFTCNQTINIKNASVDGDPIVKFAPHAMSVNADHIKIDAQWFTVRITDYYDPTNFIECLITYQVANPATGRLALYCVGRSSTQSFVGLDTNHGFGNVATIDGVNYGVRTGTNNYGAPLDVVPGKVPGQSNDISNADDYGFAVNYDTSTKRFYIRHRTNHLITDLDETSLYGANTFKGFTSDEVYVSLYCSNYSETSAKLDVVEIYGRKGSDLAVNKVVDNQGPVISFDSEVNNFYISKNEDFEIPHATASDLNLVGGVTTTVYYGFGTSSQTTVPVSSGKFRPLKSGQYHIVYEAKDRFGNTTTATRDCFAVSTEHNKACDLQVEPLTSVSAGQKVTLPEYTLNTLNDGKYLEVRAVFEDGSIEKAENGKLFFRRVGKYNVEYIYGDEVINNVYSYEVESLANNKYHYIDNIIFPKYLINKSSFSLENYNVTLVDSKELKQAVPEVYADYGNGYTKLSDPNEVFVNTQNTTADFKFVYNGKTIEEVKNVPVVDTKFASSLDMTKYFVGDITATAKGDSVNLVTNQTSGNTRIEFINPLVYPLFALDVSIPQVNFGSFDLIFTDYYDASNTMKLSFIYQANGYSVVYNNASYLIGKSTQLLLTYNVATSSFNINDKLDLYAPSVFESQRVYVAFEFTELSKAQTLAVKRINNQVFSTEKGDTFKPQIYSAPYSGTVSYGQVVKLEQFVPCDVLSPFLINNVKMNAKITLTDGSVKDVVATDGTTLNGKQDPFGEYYINCVEYGTIKVTYEYSDQAGNKYILINSLLVKDDVAPVIEINGGYNEHTVVSAKFGDKVTAQGFTVTDNISTSENIKTEVYAMSPRMEMVKITKNMTFTADYYGDWHICYYATDENSNVTVRYYVVRVN